MSLDDTAKEANIRDSLKKYMVDSIYTTEGIQLTFDKYLSTPSIQGHEVDKWVSINFGDMGLSELSIHDLTVICCTRKDGEGFKLAQLRDKVYKYLVDNTQTDGMARFPLYRSRATGTWTQLDGGFIVQEVMESRQFEADDGTKYKVLTVRLRFSSKV
uniref:Tail protein n=1 Tax=viral metagenome TaxID=1070528 RepID=A0A6M3XNQ6_9ZZZZ